MYATEKTYYKKAFFVALAMAAVLFLPFLIIDSGVFVFYGDYNAQQIPFYRLCNDAIKSGELFWNWNTDLGADFIGSYSFYTLGSPFFWLSPIVPPEYSQYVMAPLLMLKFALASLFSFMYIRRFTKKPDSALIGGLLYAFSGFSMYNVFFNHFHEVIVFFPLMLIGLEELVVNKRKGFFALTVAINALVNYFFFIGSAIFVVIYFIVRSVYGGNFKFSFKTFLSVAFEAVLGVALAGILFIPSIVSVLEIPRTTSFLLGWDLVFHNPSKRYGTLLQAMFFPPDISARQNFFPGSEARWSSVALYLPFFSMAGVISFIKFRKKSFVKAILLLCLLFAFIPGLNAVFTMFNTSYYTRWFYMPTLFCALATVLALENDEFDLSYGAKWCAFAVGMISLVAVLPSMETETVTVGDTSKTESVLKIGDLVDENIGVYISIFLAVLTLFFLFRFAIKRRKNPAYRANFKVTFTYTVIFSLVLGLYNLVYGRILGPMPSYFQNTFDGDEIKLEDDGFYRVEPVTFTNNDSMLWGFHSYKSFTSLLPNSVFEMYKLIGNERTVNSAPSNDYLELRSLLSGKYAISISDSYSDGLNREIYTPWDGYSADGEQGVFAVYKNSNFIPMGFSYDYYVTEEQLLKLSAANRDNVMVKAAALDDETAEKLSRLLSPLPKSELTKTRYENFVLDAKKLNENTAGKFVTRKNGFTAAASFDKERLLVFSVPYADGWTATVNGEKAEIYRLNGAFMGVIVPAGRSEILFDYVTPGFWTGVWVSAGAAIVWLVYMGWWVLIKKHKPNRFVHLYENTQMPEVNAASSYAEQLYEKIYSFPDKSDIKQSEPHIKWPSLNEEIAANYIRKAALPKEIKRDRRLTEDDEAYRVLKELESKKKDENGEKNDGAL